VTISVVSTPDVLGGKPRIEGTRVGVQQLGALIREHGWSATVVADEFDLTVDEIDAALEYSDAHPNGMSPIAADAAVTRDRLREMSHAPE